MIPIKIESSKAREFYKKIDTSKGRYESISSKLQNWINDNPANPDIEVARDIKKKLKEIIISNPKGLELLIEEYNRNGFQLRIFDPSLGKKGELTTFGKVIRDKFNYKSFRQSANAMWFADSINIKSCVTCNTQYTLKTSQISGKKLLFHLDHYFPKSVYPYLSLSYHNLIPCCASCNMSKSNKPFTLKDNIHPYIESFHDIAKFKLDKTSLLDFLIDPNKNENKIMYEVDIRAKYFGDKIYETKLENYLREFRINEQYVQFKDIAAETYLKSKYYEKARRKELKLFFEGSGININDELIKRFILGNYHQDKDLLKRPLAKFMKDIGEDLNI
jgi:hypothetical protein